MLGSSVRGILQSRILEWVAIPFSRGSFRPRDRTWVSCIAGKLLTIWATRCFRLSAYLELKEYLLHIYICVCVCVCVCIKEYLPLLQGLSLLQASSKNLGAPQHCFTWTYCKLYRSKIFYLTSLRAAFFPPDFPSVTLLLLYGDFGVAKDILGLQDSQS